MLKFLRIICIWICCVSCLFGRIQLPAVAAVPFEYFEDHEQLSYDLDTEQSQAKYDTRLLSEQLLTDQKSSSAEGYDDRPSAVAVAGAGAAAETAAVTEEDLDDLQPHERAASCYTGGRKYTHGQKVPRLDPCEVCLCMDGEIFCWWEKCASKRQTSKSAKYSNPSQESTTTRKSKKFKATAMTTLRPTQQQLQQQQQQPLTQKYNYDTATENQMNYEEQQQQQQQQQQKGHATKLLKKKLYQQQQKHEQYLIEQQHHQQKQKQKQQQQQQKHHQQPQHQHKHMLASSSKILSFPENLPSLLYYDYKTEEHQHHQHQHHQQHLKHQLQQQQKKQQKQQQLEEEQQQNQLAHVDDNMSTQTTAATPSPPYLSTGNDNVYDESETDSDILPEPPTKRPKVSVTSATTTSITTVRQTTPLALTNVDKATSIATTDSVAEMYNGNRNNPRDNNDFASGGNTVAGTLTIGTPSAASTRDTISNDYNKSQRFNSNQQQQQQQQQQHKNHDDKLRAQSSNSNNNKNNKDNYEERQDEAFHRWLTSTETNNHNNNSSSSNNPTGATNLDATQTAGLENPTEVKNTTATTYANNSNSNKNNNNDRNRFVYSPDQRQHSYSTTNASNAFFRSTYNDYSSEFNGSVVNIDIMLTAGDDQQQQQQQQQTQTQQQQQQQQHEEQMQQESIILEADLISNPSKTKTATTLASSNINISSSSGSSSSSSNFNVSTMSAATTTPTVVAALPESTTTPSADRQCNVMGTLYKIGDVLPQDTGNCLQCVCIDGSTSDDTPRVTCSPHNCPPLVLPDLFDATGY